MSCTAAFGPCFEAVKEWLHLCVLSSMSIAVGAEESETVSAFSTFLPHCVLVQSVAHGCGVGSLLAATGTLLLSANPVSLWIVLLPGLETLVPS
jgi:hypothetical protein